MLLIFFFNDTATTEIYTLSLHDALPISFGVHLSCSGLPLNSWSTFFSAETASPFSAVYTESDNFPSSSSNRSEEHTSELQSPCNLVCRLLLENKKHTQSA